MIVASCPLRISLVGGSTDHPEFLKRYDRGAVISFPSNLRTYITIHRDVFGINTIDENYNLNYSRRETVKNVSDIQNEMLRHCFEYLNVERINCSLVSDIYSAGSGLAASSAYLQALIKAIHVWRNEPITEFEVCKIAENVERKFNPLVGQQDFYGSMGGLKRINFFKDSDPQFRYLDTKIFDSMDIHLLYTGVLRNSTKVLESIDVSKCEVLISDVRNLEQAICKTDVDAFNSIMKKSWENKKKTSKLICENEVLVDLDNKLSYDSRVLSHKLCGAGNGGYFLIFSNKNSCLEKEYERCSKISISETGLKYVNLTNEFTRT
jgi:D-glycero-alpha-D-manno-heptose-7-phosphate kinase